jgi:hypothetical protein
MDQITVPTMTKMFGDMFEVGARECTSVFDSPAVLTPKELMRTFSLTAGNLRLFSEFDGTDVNVEPEHMVDEAAVS